MSKKRILSFLCIILICCLLFSACGGAKATTKQYVMPAYVVGWTATTAEDHVEMYKNYEEAASMATDVVANDDGSLTFVMTAEQAEMWVAQAESTIEEYCKALEAYGYSAEVNAEKTEYTMRADKDILSMTLTSTLAMLNFQCAQYQIFNGVPPGEEHLKYTLINQDNEKIMVSMEFPRDIGTGWTLKPEDWE